MVPAVGLAAVARSSSSSQNLLQELAVVGVETEAEESIAVVDCRYQLV